MNPRAVQVLKEVNVEVDTTWTSSYLLAKYLEWAHIVLCMSKGHRDYILEQFPEFAAKTHILSSYVGEPHDVADPYGSDLPTYRDTRDEIWALLRLLYAKLVSDPVPT